MEGFFLCNGNETQEIVKPTGEHDFCFRRFIGMVCTRKPGIFDLLQYVLNAIMFFEILFQIYPTILSGTPYQKFHAEASDMPPPAAAASFLFHY